MKKRTVLIFCALSVVITSLFACTKKDGTEKLCEFLFTSGYRAEFDFTLSTESGENELSGSACVTKGEKVRIDFLSPEPFASLSVESDEKGEPGVLIFNYYGMRAPLPDKAMTKISLLLSLFCDDLPKAMENRKNITVSKYTEGSQEPAPDASLKICRFVRADGAECAVVFDSASGLPQKITSSRDGFCAAVTFTKITPPEKAREDKEE